MRKVFIAILIIGLSVPFIGCSSTAEEASITSIVESFGSKLKEVSLLAPEEILKQSMEDSYSAFVSVDLINEWISDPQSAPGRLTSSPWPDRIKVLSVEKLPENGYEVKGEIEEITSQEEVNGGIAASRPITLRVNKIGDRWLIDTVTLGDY